MVKGILDGMIVQVTKATLERTKDMEKVFTSLNKAFLRGNGRMIKFRGQVIWWLATKVSEVLGVRILTKSQTNFFDI